MVQTSYVFHPVLRLDKWGIKAKSDLNSPPLEAALQKKIQKIVSKIPYADRLHSITLNKNTLTITKLGEAPQITLIEPATLILEVLEQVGPLQTYHSMIKYKELFSLIDRLEGSEHTKIPIIYNKLTNLFRDIEHAQTPIAWAQKADLMDAIDLLVNKFQKIDSTLQPIKISFPPIADATVRSQEAVPLIPYQQLSSVATNMLSEAGFEDVEALKNSFKDVFVFENTGMAGRTIQFLTKQRKTRATAYLFGLLYRLLTRFLGWHFSRNSRFKSPLTGIAKAAQRMGIRPVEILVQKIQDQEEAQFYYRGPRHLFGKSIHEFTSIDDFFRRDLTISAREEYLSKAKGMELSIERDFGNPFKNGTSRVAISNADCRARVRQLKDFLAPQEIVGKVLTEESAIEAQTEDPAYYLDTYSFTTKQLLGLSPQDALTLHKLKKDAAVADAQRELLVGMARLFLEEGAVQVVQRLAPADIHNYTAPVNGTPLTQSKAAQALQKRALALSKEKEANILEQITSSLPKDRTTIDIYGGIIGNESVQTAAITNKPSILAQNDRKILLFQHDDGSLSLHVFIGATGVNRVSVNQDSIHMDQGEQQGDMGFGTEASKGKLRQGTRQGLFDKEGSTVISYYLPADFTPLESVKKAQDSLVYQETVQRRSQNNQPKQVSIRKEVEILCQMGDPLLVKTEIMMTQQMEVFLGKEFDKSQSAEEVFMKMIDKSETQENSISIFLKKELSSLTWSEKQLRERLQHTVKERLRILRANSILEILTKEEGDIAKQLFDHLV